MCVCVCGGGGGGGGEGLMRGIKTPQQDFALTVKGGGGLSPSEGVFVGHYDMYVCNIFSLFMNVCVIIPDTGGTLILPRWLSGSCVQ